MISECKPLPVSDALEQRVNHLARHLIRYVSTAHRETSAQTASPRTQPQTQAHVRSALGIAQVGSTRLRRPLLSTGHSVASAWADRAAHSARGPRRPVILLGLPLHSLVQYRTTPSQQKPGQYPASPSQSTLGENQVSKWHPTLVWSRISPWHRTAAPPYHQTRSRSPPPRPRPAYPMPHSSTHTEG